MIELNCYEQGSTLELATIDVETAPTAGDIISGMLVLEVDKIDDEWYKVVIEFIAE